MRIEEEYAQRANAVSSLRAILDAYPLSIGIFRELLQNSDDAGASKQTFVLDRRTHSQDTLYYPGLAKAQGPALLAFNDATLRKEDWESLRSMHDSSKSDDESKIGKYGVGFRSVFNITDCPQIISDTSLAIFDPLCLFLGSEGRKIDLGHVLSISPNQLSSLEFFNRSVPVTSPFAGTVIRCPLRDNPGRLSAEPVNADTISRLFREFIDQELGISLLFLQNVKTIEIYDISLEGVSTLQGRATLVSQADPNTTGDYSTALTASVKLESLSNQNPQTKEWYIVHSNFPKDEAIRILLQQPGYHASTLVTTLKSAKFSPEIKIAADVTNPTSGRIFTYLPLPIYTGFPVHIHGLFGIDSSRKHLRSEDIGLQSGTRDHTTIEWNKLLFQIFIPRTWRFVLEHFASRVTDIFSFWPPEVSVGELNAYAASLPEHVLGTLTSAKSLVWPVYGQQNDRHEFRNLDSLIVVAPTEDEKVLRALSVMGLSLTRPPKFIFQLLAKSSSGVTILNPEVAHNVLLAHMDQITQSSDDDKYRVLDYLLSTKNVSNIRDLPLIPVVNGEKIALSDHSSNSGVAYTLLTRNEFDVFGPCDDHAIPLHLLSANVADVLRNSGPGSLNVELLAIPHIVDYLSRYSNRSDLHNADGRLQPSTVRWFSGFWDWMGKYKDRDDLFPRIRSLLVLPSTKGLRSAETPLFQHRDERPAYTQAYTSIGLPFLSGQLSDQAHAILKRYDLVKRVSDIPSLLDLLPAIPLTPPNPLNSCPDILKHLASNMPTPTPEIVQKLKRLPIYPVFTSSNPTSSVVPHWGPIPEGLSLRSVGEPTFIPNVDGLLFVGLEKYAPALVKYIEPMYPRSLSDEDLAALAVEHMAAQQQRLQLIVLRYICRGRSRIPPIVIETLRTQEFVATEDGRLCSPADVVDPESQLSSLFPRNCFPTRSTPHEQEIVKHLRTLGLLKATLSLEIIKERIQFISTNTSLPEAVGFARQLLTLLERSNMDFSKVQGIAEQKWLPTNRGLCSASECRHRNFVPPALFDRVLATLESHTIPPSLKTALGWDGPFPLTLIVQQLERSLASGQNYNEIVEIVKEFGRRQWDEEFAALEIATRNREWIPTTNGRLTDVKSAVLEFSPTMVNSGFHQVRMDLNANELLRKLGCTDRPSTKAILEKLHALSEDSSPFDVVGVSLSLLKSLPDDITAVERGKLLIPDTSSILRPFSRTSYNDIGENSRLLRDDRDFIAHPSLDETLARKLELERLGLKYAELRNLGPNMGQAPITTVRDNLKRYTEHQFLLEFLANAEDAGATEFNVALNLVTLADIPQLQVLSPVMAYLCRLPSLVVHNNALFSQKDFEGICHTSIGGKQGRSDTIGEFGLGVLTMYHFTDVTMVISGTHVLFMDPSKKHLPVPECASLTVPLSHLRRFYQDHLLVIDGLFGFSAARDSYEGTLFVLPLRNNESEPCPEFIVNDFWCPDRVDKEILKPFKHVAHDCLLFTGLHLLNFVRRDENGLTAIWTFQADRRELAVEERFKINEIVVTDLAASAMSTWRAATTSLAKDQLPESLKELRPRRNPFAGLAVQLDRVSPPKKSFNFFSSLPLSTTTSLPMHVMASFMLSSDRRQIRFDSYQKLPSQYNSWLLTDIVPPLYLFFLEHLLSSGDEHYYKRWPRPTTEKDRPDDCSQHIINGFYRNYLASSSRKIFCNSQDSSQHLTPQEIVMSGNEPRKIREALGLLASSNVVRLPEGPRRGAEIAGIRQVDPGFIRDEIMRNPVAITSDVDFSLVEDIITYLTDNPNMPGLLDGLAILPLQDNSIGTLYTQGTGPSYYVWKPKDRAKAHNFPAHHFVHPDMKTKDLLSLPINVRTLEPTFIPRLVGVQLSTYSGLQQLQWVDSFWDSWDEYVTLGLSYTDIEAYPLIPTTESLRFISLNQCADGSALLVRGDSQDDQKLRVLLTAFGLQLVRIDSDQMPEAVRSILGRKDFPEANFERILLAMCQTHRSTSELFSSLSTELQNGFAHWARKSISQNISEPLLSFVKQLPIWWSAGGGAMHALRSASDVWLLPKGLTHQIAARFIEVCVADDPALQHLQPNTLSFQDVTEKLLLPDIFEEEELQHYKLFFGTLVRHLPNSFQAPLPVPTSDNSYGYSNDLFARSDLFLAIFPPDSGYFVHPEFAEYEHMLHGLKREDNLDVDLFIQCVERLDVNDPDAIPRARELFHAYSEILPLRLGSQGRDAWSHQLDNLVFVPRRMDRERKLDSQAENETGLVIPLNVMHLGPIVEPSELVREEFEPIAWSQRGCFEVQPETVLLVHSALGRPSLSEVIAHLHYLAALEHLRTSQRQILLHDLQKTYQYLDENIPLLLENYDRSEITAKLGNAPLFLNIENTDDRLNWVKAGSLAFGCHENAGSIQNVRGFLSGFDRLLTEAGVLRVYHPQVGLRDADEEVLHEKLQAIWSGFNRLRQENALVDVVFRTEDHAETQNPEPLYAHRAFLAAFSDYFKGLFVGDYRDSRNMTDSSILEIPVSNSRDCVKAVVDYIYTGKCSLENSPLELLLEILDLSNYWHILDLFNDTQNDIVRQRYITPDTVQTIRDLAERCQAEDLLEACEMYQARNPQFIQKVRQSQQDTA